MTRTSGTVFLSYLIAGASVCLLAPQASRAASGSWTGAESAAWTNSANWSAAPYAGAAPGETATFNGDGNGNTTIDLTGLASISRLTFDTASAAAYTLGAGGVNAQALVLESSGTVAVNQSVSAGQTINAALLLGTNTASATYVLTNASPDSVLTLSGNVMGAASGGTAGTKTLNLTGYGRIVLSGDLANGGATGITLNSYGTNTLAGNNTFAGSITVYDGTLRLTHSNALGSGTKTITAANNVGGRNPSIVLDGSAGDLTIPANVTFNTSQSRAGAVINEAGNNTILGSFTLTSGDGATHIWSKGGKLTIAGTLRPTATDRALYLRGDADGEISGVITNGSTTALPVLRDVGTGTWTLSGVNTFSGATTVSAGSLVVAGTNGTIVASSSIAVSGGASLVVSNTASANQANRVKDSAAVALASGTLSFANDGTAANFAEKVGVVTLSSGDNTVSASQAAEGQTSALTLSGLSRSGTSTVNFFGAGLGQSDRNRIFINGQADGVIGSWALVNGTAPAFYSSTRGVYQPALVIAAKGDVLVDGSEEVVIETEGSGGPDELSAAVTAVGTLYQHSVYTSTVNTAEKILRADKVMIYPSMSDLILGVSTNDGSVTPAATGGELALVNNSVNGTLTVNASIADNGSSSSLSKSGAGLVLLTGSNTYSGQTWVRAGTLGVATVGNVGEAGSLGQPPTAELAAIKLGSMSTNAYLRYTGPGETANRAIDMAGTTGNVYIDQAGSGTLKITTNITYSGAGGKSLILQGSTEGVGELAGVFTDGLPYTNKLIKTGTGKWILSNVSTHRGETEIQNGTLSLTHPNAISASSTVRFTTHNGVLSLDHSGAGETEMNVTIGVGNSGTIASGVGAGGVGVNHVFNDFSLSQVTLKVTRASSVMSGTPSVSARTVNLSGGNAYTTTIYPYDADLTLGSVAILSGSFAKVLRLDGVSAGNTVAGPIYNGINTLSVYKANASTWTLYGSNTYSGATTVNGGTLVLSGAIGAIAANGLVTVNADALLIVSNTPSLNHANRLYDTAPLTLSGGTFDYAHSGGSADYSEAVGAVTLSPSTTNIVRASRADTERTSTLTFASLSRGAGAAVDFTGDGLGTDTRNRVMISNQPEGIIGFWAACNGAAPALYSAALGVTANGFTDSEIAARGPSSTIPDSAFVNARITTAGESGPIALESASVNSVAMLQQCTTTTATVATAGKTLRTHAVVINAGQEALTIGVNEDDGGLTALADGGKLELVNDASAPLTVNAALSNNAASVSLVKNGTGDVLFKGACSYSGDTAINAGSLTYASSATQALAGVISGAGDLIKAGTNILTLAGRNTYTGVTYINEGIVLAQTNQAFGATSAGTIIASGATLDVGANRAANTLNLGSEPFTVSGAGVGGKGAIVNNSGTSQYSVLGQVTMVGDTTFGGAQSAGRFDIRNNTPTLNMNSYTLTKVGPNMFSLTSATVNPGTGGITVAEGTLRLESNTRMNGSVTNTVTLRGGTTLELYQHYPQNACKWSLLCDDGATLSVVLGSAAQSNNWAGPVTLNGTLKLTGSGNYFHALGGVISGPGSIVKYGASTTFLTNDFNTYSGFTWITNGTVYVSSIRSVGAASSSLGAPATTEAGTIKLGGGASSASLVYTGTGDTSDRILDLAGTTGGATLYHSGSGPLTLSGGVTASGSGAKTLTIRGAAATGGQISGSIVNPSIGKVALTKSDSGTWTLSGNNSCTGDVTISNGKLILTGSNAQGPGAVLIASAAADASMRLASGSQLTSDGTIQRAGGIMIGTAGAAHGALYLEEGATVSRSPGTGDDQAFTVAKSAGSYGYFNMSGGTLKTTRIQTGCSGTFSSNTVGNVRVTGGTITFPDYILIARGRGSVSAFTVEGGTINHTNASNHLSIGYEGGRGELNLTGGTLESFGKYLTVRQSADYPTGIVNLCSGLLSVDLMQNTAPGVALLNFAGGTLKAGNVNSTVFVPTTFNGVYSYGAFGNFPGGAFIDSATRNITLAAPLKAPTGQGVTAISLSDSGSGFIGEPYISIQGGGGLGATAIANMADDGSGNGTFRVASVTITCPGTDYTSTPEVIFNGGGRTAVVPTIGTISLAPNTSGGLTKLGEGTLTLGAANTYTGATTIAAGTLKLGAAGALPTQTQVFLAGGTLDLSGYTVTNSLYGSGQITNGTVQTDLSPAGAGTIGTNTLTLANSSLKGTYLADVSFSGACDRINILGNIDLTNIALQLVNPEALNRLQAYTVLTCTGARTGQFSSTNLPEGRWHLLYRANGEVVLLYSTGTFIMFR